MINLERKMTFRELQEMTGIYFKTLHRWYQEGRISHPNELTDSEIEQLRQLHELRGESGWYRQ